MKLQSSILFLTISSVVLVIVHGEPPLLRRPFGYPLWPGKSAKQIVLGRQKALHAGGKQRTLMVQIRSDQPVPLVLKGGRNSQLRHGLNHLRGVRPVKLTGPVYLKAGPIGYKQLQRKPLKIKLTNSKIKNKPATSYDVPFRFEMPTNNIAYPPLGNEVQQLSSETHSNFITEHSFDYDHFAPIHTIPAPNLSLPENHSQEQYLPPKSQSQSEKSTYHQTLTKHNTDNQYQVTEEYTNDQTIRDPQSGAQKLFAPDPDPSLPTAQLRPVTEHFNQPSNGKPLPVDVQTNYLVPAQPLVQIIGGQEVATPEIYPIQFTQQAQLQPLVSANVAAIHAAPAPLYDPTYLVTQSNHLYSQHQQQLFHPSASLEQNGYPNADLTQEVASDGQILQAAKDPHHNIHPVLDGAPQFAALIAAPLLSEQTTSNYNNLQPQAAALTATSAAPEGGFIVSNYYDNSGQDNTQLLQAYAEEEAQRLEIEAEQEKQQYVLQQQQQQHQQQEQHLLALQQQHDQQQQQQELQQKQELQQQHQLHQQLAEQMQEQQLRHQQLQQQQQLHQQHQQQLQQQQQQQQQLQQQQQQQQQQYLNQQQQSLDPAAAAFHEHQRLVQQQLGADTPLRIFVPDDEAAGETRLQKRSDMIKKGTVENSSTTNDNNNSNTASGDDLFEVSSSVEVSNESQKDEHTTNHE